MNKVAQLTITKECGPYCSAICGGAAFTPPSGATAFYYSIKISETNGVGARVTQKCRDYAACGSYIAGPASPYCISYSPVKTIPAGGNVVIPGAIYSYCYPRVLTETYYITDDNGNSFTQPITFTLNC
ncbi:MAG: hypothetical protein PHU49_00415 [Syntrophorhabdaceae bacterium]|nr:hypothetical protein [Syntrophorhabdaceae bacterium]